MNNLQFAKELEKRTKKFAVRIIRVASRLPNTPEGRIVRSQLTGAGTSVGANYREANRSRSQADFKNKIALCESEASETQYWMEIVIELEWMSRQDIEADYKECGELLAIFTSIRKKFRSQGLTKE